MSKKIKDLKTDEDIYNAGKFWKKFDYEMGLDALIQKDKTGTWIFIAGKDWKQFDYDKGLDALIEKDKNGELIYYAGSNWDKFDYDKGLDAIKNTRYYRDALRDWPKGIKASEHESRKIAKTAKKLPMKKLKLEATAPIKDFEHWARFNSFENIIKAGIKARPGFDYGKALKIINKKLLRAGYGSEGRSNIILDALFAWPRDLRNILISILNRDSDTRWMTRHLIDIDTSRERIKKLGKTSKKLPMKKLKLTEQQKYTEVRYMNKSFYNDLKRVYRAFKKVENPDKKKRLGFYLQAGRKIQGNKENIDRIIRDVFGKEEELSPNEVINRIVKFETPAGKKLYIKPESAYQTTQRLVSNQKLNKTISVSIFGEIYDDILSKYKKLPEGDDVIRAVNRHISGHFVDAAAFIRWTNMAQDWVHIDAFQTDFFNNIKAIANKDPNFKEIADDIRAKENEFWKTAMSYVVRTNPSAKVWTANTEELVKAIERVRGEVKLKEYYYKLPKLLGFRLINLEKLKQILRTRPGSETEKKIETFEKAIKRQKKDVKVPTISEYGNIAKNIATSIMKAKEVNKKAGKETEKHTIDAIISSYTREEEALSSAFHQFLDDLHSIANERKKTATGEIEQPYRYLINIRNEIIKIMKEKKEISVNIPIWWANRQLLFESILGKKSFNLLESLFDDLTRRV